MKHCFSVRNDIGTGARASELEELEHTKVFRPNNSYIKCCSH